MANSNETIAKNLDDDVIIECLPTALGYPDEKYQEQITAILMKQRTSIINKGDDLSLWLEESITTSNAQMSEKYAEKVLEKCRDDCKQKSYFDLPTYGVTLDDVLPRPYKPNNRKRYGDTLYDYKARIRELGTEIGVVRDGMFIVEGAIRKAKMNKEIEDAKKKGGGYL